jgi:acetolactate synthase I/II/III large subunit
MRELSVKTPRGRADSARECSVAEAMADAFAAEGVDTVFALMGDGNMHFLPHLRRRGAQIYNVRHENMALAMADGYYRVTGRVGVCSVTCGPGLTQISTCLMIARRRHSAVVIMAGDSARVGGYGGLQEMDQRAFVEASGGIFQPVRLPETLDQDVRSAFHSARVLPAPVVLNVPIDIQLAHMPSGWSYAPSDTLISACGPLSAPVDDVDRVVELIELSERPVILAGRGAMDPSTVAALEELADTTGALLATTLPAKGVFAGNPFDLGVAGGYASTLGFRLLENADLIVAVGASLSYYTTHGDRLFANARIVHVNRDANALVADRRRADAMLIGDAAATLGVLSERLGSRRARAVRYRTPEIVEQLAHDPRVAELELFDTEIEADTVDPRRLAMEIDEALPDACVIVSCGAHSGSFPGRFLTGKRSRQFIHSSEFGAIGQAMSTAIGVALAHGDRLVVAFEGDGAAMMNIQELDTAARYGARILFVILNDEAFGTELHRLRADPDAYELAQIASPDFVAVARAFGIDGSSVRRRGEARTGVLRCLNGTGPYLLDARISRRVVNVAMFG